MKKQTKIFLDRFKESNPLDMPNLAGNYYNTNLNKLDTSEKKEFIDYVATYLQQISNPYLAIEFLNYLNWKGIPLEDELDIRIYYSNDSMPEYDADALSRLINKYQGKKSAVKKIIRLYMNSYHREEINRYEVISILLNKYQLAKEEIIDYVCTNATDEELKLFLKYNYYLNNKDKERILKYIIENNYCESLIEILKTLDLTNINLDMTTITGILINGTRNKKEELYEILTNHQLLSTYLKSYESKEILFDLLYKELEGIYPRKKDIRYYIEDNKIVKEHWDETEYLKYAEVLFQFSRMTKDVPLKEIEQKLVECANKNDLVETLLIKFAKIVNNPNFNIINYFIKKGDYKSILDISKGKANLDYKSILEFFFNKKIDANAFGLFIIFSHEKEGFPTHELIDELITRKNYEVLLNLIDNIEIDNKKLEIIFKEVIETKNFILILKLINKESINIDVIAKYLVIQNDRELINELALSSKKIITDEILIYLINLSDINDVMNMFRKGNISDYKLFTRLLLDNDYLIYALECLNNKPEGLSINDDIYKNEILAILSESGYDQQTLDKYFDNAEYIISHIDDFITYGIATIIEENNVDKNRILSILKSDPQKYKKEILVYFNFLKENDNRLPDEIDKEYFNKSLQTYQILK